MNASDRPIRLLVLVGSALVVLGAFVPWLSLYHGAAVGTTFSPRFHVAIGLSGLVAVVGWRTRPAVAWPGAALVFVGTLFVLSLDFGGGAGVASTAMPTRIERLSGVLHGGGILAIGVAALVLWLWGAPGRRDADDASPGRTIGTILGGVGIVALAGTVLLPELLLWPDEAITPDPGRERPFQPYIAARYTGGADATVGTFTTLVGGGVLIAAGVLDARARSFDREQVAPPLVLGGLGLAILGVVASAVFCQPNTVSELAFGTSTCYTAYFDYAGASATLADSSHGRLLVNRISQLLSLVPLAALFGSLYARGSSTRRYRLVVGLGAGLLLFYVLQFLGHVGLERMGTPAPMVRSFAASADLHLVAVGGAVLVVGGRYALRAEGVRRTPPAMQWRKSGGARVFSALVVLLVLVGGVGAGWGLYLEAGCETEWGYYEERLGESRFPVTTEEWEEIYQNDSEAGTEQAHENRSGEPIPVRNRTTYDELSSDARAFFQRLRTAERPLPYEDDDVLREMYRDAVRYEGAWYVFDATRIRTCPGEWKAPLAGGATAMVAGFVLGAFRRFR